jgi:uncharacterized phage protein gp47/JayE
MPYSRPALTDLKNEAIQDVNAAQITSPANVTIFGLLQKAVIRILAIVQAGFAFQHYDFLDWISLMAVPFTAAGEFLSGWGSLKGVLQEDATFASSPAVTFTVVGAPSIPSGTLINRGGDSFPYQATADATISGTTATVPIVALTAGSAGNCDVGTAMALASPIANVQSVGVVATQVSGGADQETTDDYRTRVLDRYAAPAQGGDMSDYIEWALTVPGVTRAWVARNAVGSGSVTVYTMLDEAEETHGGFPQGSNGTATNEPRGSGHATGDQLNVANAIFPVQPVTALVYSNAPTPSPVNFTITDLGANNTTAMQANIVAALKDMFVRLANVGGTVNPSSGAAWAAIEPSDWYAALEAIPGLTMFNVTVPAASIIPATGAMFTVGTMTYVT